jgi:hypothetical protein
MSAMLRVPRSAALVAIAVLILASAGVSFAESYRGLYEWAEHHGLSGFFLAVWPLQVDVFIAVGELALFVGLADRWPPRSRVAAWSVTGVGLVVSVAGNVGHVADHALTSRATAAVPPLAAAAALAVGLGVLKRVVAAYPAGVLVQVQAATDMPAAHFQQHIALRHPGLPRSQEEHAAQHAMANGHLGHVHNEDLPD